MIKSEVIEALQKEAKENPVSNAVFHVWALRKRTRNVVVLQSLYNKMKKEGFNYSKAEYAPTLQLVAVLGFGTLHKDAKGRIRGLKDIKTTLQSIGTVACGDKTVPFKVPHVRHRFVNIVPHKIQTHAVVVKNEASKKCQVNLEVAINGKAVYIPVPKDFTTEEIASLINRLQSA